LGMTEDLDEILGAQFCAGRHGPISDAGKLTGPSHQFKFCPLLWYEVFTTNG